MMDAEEKKILVIIIAIASGVASIEHHYCNFRYSSGSYTRFLAALTWQVLSIINISLME